MRIAGDGVDRNIRESKGDVFLTSTTGPNCWKKLRTTPVWGEKSAKLIEAFALDTVKPEVTRPSLRGRCCTKCRRTFVDASIETSDKDLTPGGRISRARHVCHVLPQTSSLFPLGVFKRSRVSGEVRNTLGLSTMIATCPALCVRFVIRKGWGGFAAIVPAPRRDRRLGVVFFPVISSDLYFISASVPTSRALSPRVHFVLITGCYRYN